MIARMIHKQCVSCGGNKSPVGRLCRSCFRISIVRIRKRCSVAGCQNEDATAGMCNSHYLRLRRWGSTDVRIKKTRVYKSKWERVSCRVTDCDKPIKANALCDSHYHRLLRYGDPTYKPRDANLSPCVQPKCNGTTRSAHGFCKRHRRKVYAAKEYGSKQRIARLAAWYAEKKGLLIRPAGCTKCGSAKRIEAHHPDYAKPLDVIYLCKRCHVAVHKSMK